MKTRILLLIILVETIQVAYGRTVSSIDDSEWMNKLFYEMFGCSPLCYRFSDSSARNIAISFKSPDELVVENMPDPSDRHLRFVETYKFHVDNSNACRQTKKIVVDRLVSSNCNRGTSASCQLPPYSTVPPKTCGEVLHVLEGDTIVLSHNLRFLSIGNMIYDSSDKDYGAWVNNKKLCEIVPREQIVGHIRRGLSSVKFQYELEDYLYLIRKIMALYK